MSRRVMRDADFEQFKITLQMWLGLRICTPVQLARRTGISHATVFGIIGGRHKTTYFTAELLIQAVGIIERKYIAQWQQQRSKAK